MCGTMRPTTKLRGAAMETRRSGRNYNRVRFNDGLGWLEMDISKAQGFALALKYLIDCVK